MTTQSALQQFNDRLTQSEREFFDSLRSPAQIQAFLDQVRYPSGSENRSSLEVYHQRQAHCLDGGLFAVTALRRIGFPPLVVDLQPDAGMDDDHVLAIYKIEGCWGAVAKSNYSGLRFREPIYRSLRELVISYFDDFFNVNGVKTLRYYTRPIDLGRFDSHGWMLSSSGVDWVEGYLKQVKVTSLLTPAQIALLSPIDKRSFDAGSLGLNPKGSFQPKQ
jgi:hypothetical protein